MDAFAADGNARSRKLLPKVVSLILLLVGIAGLALAAATQLGSAWTGNFQAGAIEAGMNCQAPDSLVHGKLLEPTFDPNGAAPWEVTQVEFSNIDSHCIGSSYEIAYRTGGGTWVELDTSTGKGIVSGSRVVADLGEFSLESPVEFAIVFHN